MARKSNILPLVLLFSSFAHYANAQAPTTSPTVFDITRFGAKPDGDITAALTSVWKEACTATAPSTIVIPKANFNLVQIQFQGPCKAPITLQVQGTIKAPADPAQIPNKKAEWITIDHVDHLTISGGGVFDGQGQKAWQQNNCGKDPNCAKTPYNLSFNALNNSVITDVTTKDSKNFHVNVIGCNNVTFQRFTVSAPAESLNTDGIHIGRSSAINITDTTIATGDDCISIGDDTRELHVQNVACGPGHGISVGSLGRYQDEKDVTGIYVKNVTFTNTDNGVRVKSWPSSPAHIQVTDIHFEDITMNNVTNPIVIDQEYCPYNQCKLDTPSQVKISKVSVKNVKGTSAGPVAVTMVCSKTHPCENVELGDIDLTYTGKQGPITTKCANVKPATVGKLNPPMCANPTQSA